MEKSVRAAVKAVIVKDHKFLIVKQSLKNKEIWDLPGGKIEYGETPYEALHREIKEEVSLEIEIKKNIGVWWFMRIDGQGQIVCTTFLCSLENGEVDLSSNPADESISTYQWITKEAFLSDEYSVSDKSLKELIMTLKIV